MTRGISRRHVCLPPLSDATRSLERQLYSCSHLSTGVAR